MLTEDAKTRIRLEEEYRLGIRNELESSREGKTWKARIWVMLNSTFALWFLSSVVLGVLTWAYSGYVNRLAVQSAEMEHNRRLDLEISGRIDEIAVTLGIWGSDKIMLEDRLFSLSGMYLGVAGILDNDRVDGGGNRHDDSAFPEFRERHFSSLVVERLSTADAVHKKYFLEAREGYKRFYRLGHEEDPPDLPSWPIDRKVSAVKEVIANSNQILREKFIDPEWSTDLFQNSDAEKSPR
jgi:hypothetical protein